MPSIVAQNTDKFTVTFNVSQFAVNHEGALSEYGPADKNLVNAERRIVRSYSGTGFA